ncbi:MAG: VCBS repeat-containing protein [Candidatus Eisenbacteria bacterium]|nr:VCBS repeat-containing protein [Candidatus Eisenbacteria bacterium]
MARTAIGAVMVAMSLLWAATAAGQSVVYWTAAHELAPPGQYMSCLTTWGDLDGDGDPDVSSRRQHWNDGTCPGTPAWRTEASVLPDCANCTAPRTATLGDLDADGDLDLIYGCAQPGLRMFWNVGTPQVPQWQQDLSMFDSSGGNWTCPRLADLDGDGDLDLVNMNSGGWTWLRKNTGTPQTPQWGPWEGMGQGPIPPDGSIALGDLDGDGDLDLVTVSTEQSPRAWENVGTPQAWQFVENPAMLTGVNVPPPAWGLALLDVDCDGDPDLLLSGFEGVVYLYLNDSVTSVTPTTWGTIKALYK